MIPVGIIASRPAASGGIVFDEGFNFRELLADATDPANTQFVAVGTTYPTTADGATFGWTPDIPANRFTQAGFTDARVAGAHYKASSIDFRVDLPAAGTYAIDLAMGDRDNPQSCGAAIYDDSSLASTLFGITTVAGGSNIDANGNQHTRANWATNKTTKNVSFSTQICLLRLTTSGFWTLNHFRVTAP